MFLSTLKNFVLILLVTNFQTSADEDAKVKPNIIFIMADDLGWNDLSFHGSSQIFTPNIDSLAFSGIILNRYYVSPICTPSRSALMTGKYPIHLGMQHGVLYGASPYGLPLSEKLLPQYLKKLGYMNHIVGKWHLGSYKRSYTPLFRGFDSHVGFWTGHHDYFDHTAEENDQWGLDMRRGLNVAYDLHGKYTTDVITDESVEIIKNHNHTKPLFLYVAHAATHSGNPYNPLAAPDETVAKIKNIKDFHRRKFAAMVYHLDQSVGAIVEALSHNNILQNSIIIFSTDNGGPAEGFNLNAASNYPLRGVKNTLWEGGVRGAGFIWSPLLKSNQRVSNELFHITDWLPTILGAAGGNFELGNLDGINQWKELSTNTQSKRTEILHNIDNIWGSSAIQMKSYKLVKGTNYEGAWDYWFGPAGTRSKQSYDVYGLFKSKSANALKTLNMMPSFDHILQLRQDATINCNNKTKRPCNPLIKPCLYNIYDDPCEYEDISFSNEETLNLMLTRLQEFNQSSVPIVNKPLDKQGSPKYWSYTWTNFGDYEETFVDIFSSG